MKNKLITDGMIGKYIKVCYPEVEIVEYSSNKKYWSNFGLEYSRVLEYSRQLYLWRVE